MADKNKQNSTASGAGDEGNENAGNDDLRGAPSKTGASGKSMIEENSAENTQGSGITGGNVIGGVGPEAGEKAGVDTNDDEETGSNLSGRSGSGTGNAEQNDDDTRTGTSSSAGDNS